MGVVAAPSNEFVRMVFVEYSVFVTVAIIVVHKTCHVDFQWGTRDGIVVGSIGFRVEGIKIDAAIEIPYGRRRFAALTCPKDGEVVAVLIVAGRNAHLSFNSIDGLLEHISLYRGDVVMKSEGAANYAGQIDHNAIIACSGIIGEFQVAETEETAVLVLQDLDSDWVQGGSGCACPEVTVVNGFCVFSFVVCNSVLGTKEEVIVVFVEVYHAETMDPGIASLFFDHGIDDILPASEAVCISDTVVEERVVNLPDVVSAGCHGNGCVRVGLKAVAFENGVVVAEVAARGRGAC